MDLGPNLNITLRRNQYKFANNYWQVCTDSFWQTFMEDKMILVSEWTKPLFFIALVVVTAWYGMNIAPL